MYGKAGKYSIHYDLKDIGKGIYYTFTPTPISKRDLYLMDDELMLLLLRTHHKLGVLEGLFHAMPDSEIISKRLLLSCNALQLGML